jgi:MFS family permease
VDRGARRIRPAAVVFAALAQTTQGSAALSLVLVGATAGLRLGVTSLAVAGYALGAAVGRPFQARLLDRFPALPTLVVCAVGHAVASIAIAVSGSEQSAWGLVGSGVLLGLSLPPIATWQRVHWPRRFAVAVRAFAVISLVQMAAVLLGPLLFGAISAASGSADGATATVGILAAVGTIGFALLERGGATERALPTAGSARRHIGPLLWGTLGGIVAGSISVIAPAFAIRAGHPSAAALLVAAETVGGMVGGLVASRSTNRATPHLVFLVGATLQVIGSAILVARPPLGVAAIALLVEGLGLVPTLSAVSAMIARRSGGSAQFFGWQSTAQALGTAAGSALAGAVADSVALGGLRGSAVIPLVCAAVMVATAVSRRRSDQAGTLSGSSGPGIGSTGAGGSVSGVSGDSSPGSSGTGSAGSIGG